MSNRPPYFGIEPRETRQLLGIHLITLPIAVEIARSYR
jgi:hypothetical protein